MKKLLLLVLLLVSAKSYAQQNPDELVTAFFQEYPKGPAKALETLYTTNPWVSRNKDAVEQLKSEINKLTPDFVGRYYGYEPIMTKRIANSFVLKSYLVRYDRQPLRFTFEFYKANDKWFIYAFKFDTNLDDELEESAKLNYLSLDQK
ncbi:hypothetical protein GCM10027048_04140 [Hymenobacter coalescens]